MTTNVTVQVYENHSEFIKGWGKEMVNRLGSNPWDLRNGISTQNFNRDFDTLLKMPYRTFKDYAPQFMDQTCYGANLQYRFNDYLTGKTGFESTLGMQSIESINAGLDFGFSSPTGNFKSSLQYTEAG